MSRGVDVNVAGRLNAVVSIDETGADVNRLRALTPTGARTPPRSGGIGAFGSIAEAGPPAANVHGSDSRSPVAERERLIQLCFRAEREGTADAWSKVTPLLHSQLRESPKDGEAWILLARGALAQGKESEALRSAQEALKLNGDAKLGHALHAMIAKKCIGAGEWDMAIWNAEAALTSQPSDVDVLEYLAKALFKQEKFDQAEAALGVMARCGPERTAALACSFAREATSPMLRHQYLTLAASWDRGASRPLRDLGEVCVLLQRDQEAIHWFHKALSQNPADAEVALKLAQMHLRSGHGVEEALEVYRTAARASSDNYQLHRKYGELLLKERRASEAAEVIRIAARLAPPGDTSSLYVALAELQQSMGLIPEAMRAWEAAVALDEGNVPAWRGLASAAAAAGQDRTQLRALKQLNGREPQNPDWLTRLGTLLAAMNSVDEAKDHFSRALKLDSSNVQALLGLAQLTSGTEATELYERAARADPSNEAAVAGAVAARQQAAQQKRTTSGTSEAVIPVSSSGTPKAGATPKAAAAAATGDWRDELVAGQPIEVYSKSAGKWLAGSVVQCSGDMVKLKYLIDDHWCEKVLLKSSEFLRVKKAAETPIPPAQSAPLKSVAPAQPARAPGGYPTSSTSPRSTTPTRSTKSPRSTTPTRSTTPSKGISPTGVESRSPQAGSSDAGKGIVAEDPPRRQWTTPAPAPAPAPQPKPAPKSSKGVTAELLEPSDLEFGKVLGSGGFGAVHRGTYRGEEVAIKKLHVLDGQITHMQLEEFKKEVGNLQALRHERLVSFIGAAYVAPSLCIVTEFMPNGSLYDLLHQRRQRLTVPQSYQISVQITEGVEFLHSKTPPFVHRDLKSLNVVMNYQLDAKLCDFGLTQSMEKTHISRRENEGGSPRYMAPELFDSKGRITEKVDVWALGCLALEVYAGRVPHEECSTIQQVMIKTLVDKKLPFIDFNGVPRELRALGELCFVFDPRQRIGASEFLEGLRSLKP